MMEREDGTPNFHRLISAESCSSDLSSDSCEYYQTEIFGQLPSSQAHRWLHAETIADDQSLLDRVSWNPSVPLRNLPVCLQDKRDIRTVVGYKHSWLTGNRFSSNLSYKVFCGWDFCIQNPQAALLKHNFIRNELRMDLEEQTFQQRVQQRSLKHWVQLIFLRILLNFLVLVLLGSSFALIYFAIQQKTKCENNWTACTMLEYLPPITMTTVNYILPHVFSKISEFEDYSLTIQLNLTLIRSIFLKLSSLAIYLVFFIMATEKHKVYQCRENEFGKEMYKLTIFNLLECFFNAFCVAYPRVLLVESFPSSKLVQLLGKKQFEITFNVLDLVYIQTVILVGVFYCPLLPAINTVRLLLLFYVKKRMFRTASSSVLFHFMLLLGLFMAVVTLVVNINRFEKSTCGPFEGNRTLFKVTSVCINTLPIPVQTTIGYMSSEAFAFALILAEVVILTSYVSRGRANRKAIERLKDMLVMCSSDKRFLVKQHSTIMRRQQRPR
ncbi:hypothetical protein cypCar_00031419 [Cyprinus carpio]|nr:hypothetical protein cypCar_00031419 [Cyprinus carpio]